LTGARNLQLSPSPKLAAVIVAAHLCAAAAAAVAFPGWPGAALAAALAALGLASAWSRALLRSPGSVRGLRLDGEALVLELAGGASLAAEPAAARYVSRLLVALPLRRPARALLVTADMLDPDSFRALRVWALWGRVAGVAGKQLAI
jgi:hypothetical protein